MCKGYNTVLSLVKGGRKIAVKRHDLAEFWLAEKLLRDHPGVPLLLKTALRAILRHRTVLFKSENVLSRAKGGNT